MLTAAGLKFKLEMCDTAQEYLPVLSYT